MDKIQKILDNMETWVDVYFKGSSRQALFNDLVDSLRKELSKQQSKDTDAHDNAFLRMLLWAQHPCQGKYGDDGELQCNKCRIDFKRDSVIAIEKKITFKNLQAFSESKDTEILNVFDKLTDDFDMLGRDGGQIFISIGGKTYRADNIRDLIEKLL